jgi:hypothetical protein
VEKYLRSPNAPSWSHIESKAQGELYLHHLPFTPLVKVILFLQHFDGLKVIFWEILFYWVGQICILRKWCLNFTIQEFRNSPLKKISSDLLLYVNELKHQISESSVHYHFI